VDGYDSARGDFAAYAVPTVVGKIKRHFRDRTWSIRVVPGPEPELEHEPEPAPQQRDLRPPWPSTASPRRLDRRPRRRPEPASGCRSWSDRPRPRSTSRCAMPGRRWPNVVSW
jgi:hypothetical protein